MGSTKKFIHNLFDPASGCQWTYIGEEDDVIRAAIDHVVLEEVGIEDNNNPDETRLLEQRIKNSLVDA